MFTLKRTAIFAALGLVACVTPPQQQSATRAPALGVPMSADELAAWDISIPPSGAGHGLKGVGNPADALAGGKGTLDSKTPLRTVGSYWPYATTLFDYVRRAMPLTAPLSLTDDEVYAVSAYLLYLNGIIAEDLAMNAQSLPQVKMPNRDGFVSDWPPRAHN